MQPNHELNQVTVGRVRSEPPALSWIEERPGPDANGEGCLTSDEWEANLLEIQNDWGRFWKVLLAG